MFLFDQHNQPWNTGGASISYDYHEIYNAMLLRGHIQEGDSPPHSISSVSCLIGRSEFDVVALLDTGSVYCVAGGIFAEMLMSEISNEDHPIDTLSSRHGVHQGIVVQTSLKIKNILPQGEDLEIEAPFWVCPTFHNRVVLGVRGFVNKLSLGIEPALRAGDRDLLLFGLPRGAR